MSILTHVDASVEERDAYLRRSGALRRAGEEENGDIPDVSDALSEARGTEMEAAEQFLLSITENGYGKRTSAYEYRITGRGGQGIINIETTARNGNVVATFPVADSDQLMLVTDAGKLIRVPVFDIRIAGRGTQGVTIFRTAEEEHVVSVARLAEDENGHDENGDMEDTPEDEA
jgi:DNA gyrase subunit A